MKTLFKLPLLLLALMLIILSCGSEENKNKESGSEENKNKGAICNLIADQKKLMTDIIKHGEFDSEFYAYLDSDSVYYALQNDLEKQKELLDNHNIEIEKRIIVLKTEWQRIEAESDKYMELRDGITEEDVKANQETATNCPEFSEIDDLLNLEEFKEAIANMCYFNEIKDLGGPWCQMEQMLY